MASSARRAAGGGRSPPIDFAAIAAAALQHADVLVPQWLPGGKRVGHEYQCGDLAGGAGDSCSVNLTSGAWADFATDDRGGDLISLYAAVRGIKQGPAARELARQLGIEIPAGGRPRSATRPRPEGTAGTPGARPSEPSAKPAAGASSPQSTEHPPAGPGRKAATARAKSNEQAVAAVAPLAHETTAGVDDDAWHDAGAWPADGPPPPAAHRYRGKPQASWVYRDAEGGVLGFVHRFATSAGGKEILPCVWSRHAQHGMAWKWRAFDAPRPLFALDLLAARPRAPVLVVEGEKCAEIAQQVLGDSCVVTTWPGGCKATAKADWARLAGRRVVIWPDADAKRDQAAGHLLTAAAQPGMAAAERIALLLAPHAAQVRIVAIPPPGECADGWDVADCVAEAGGADSPQARAAVLAWLAAERLRAPADSTQAARAAGGSGARPPAVPPGGGPPDDPAEHWRAALIWRRGELVPHVANTLEILRHDARWQGVVAFDEFGQRVLKRAPPPYYRGCAGEWMAEDDTRTAAWLAQQYGLQVSSKQVVEAVETLARERSFHPVVEHLRSLVWDGERRAEHWITTYLGVPDSPYVRAVAQLWLRAMVKRVMQPGCKFDHCLVLEGAEGLKKSTLAELMGVGWGSDAPLDLDNNREAAIAVHGNWVMEFAEMEAVTRAEAHLQKSFLSRREDQYRPFWSGRTIKVKRQCVFIGTTNETEYIKTPQGARRFWPIEVTTQIDIEGLRRAMPQLLAEAVADVDAGERWYPSEEEQYELFRPEQQRRVIQESLIDALHDWVLEPPADEASRRLAHSGQFSLASAAFHCLHISYAQLTRDLQSRIGTALAALGCERLEKRNGMTRYWYKPPQKAARSSTAHGIRQPAQPSMEDGDDIPC